ncbi:MAG: pilus assembly protein PilM [Candidatus Marinimicrobia bacterium]|nr:pilus assembly protein PilM [Candidatus Neomarinimicrobiota bacterium]
MPDNKILKEDATKRLIELLRESDIEDENEGKSVPVKEPVPKISKNQISDNKEDEKSVENDSNTLLDFLNQKNDDDKPVVKNIGSKKEVKKTSKDIEIETDEIFSRGAINPDTETDSNTDNDKDKDKLSVPDTLSQGPADLQSLLANLDNTMSSDEKEEILGDDSSNTETAFKPSALFADERAKKSEESPLIIDGQMAASVSQAKPKNEEKIKKTSRKYIRKFNYDELYKREKSSDEEYIHNWNAGEFFKSVLYLKDTAYGLDFGDDYICYVEVKKRQDKLEITNWGYTELIQNEKAQNTAYIKKKNDDVFSTVFNNYITQLRLKNKYIAHAIQNKNVVSRLFSFPKLTPAEVREAIEFNARKNLPFPDKFAQIDYAEIGSDSSSQKKYNYLVSIGHERSINSIISRFKEAGISPRKLFPASLAMWSLFKNNYPDYEEQSVILLHIGEKVSSIVFINEGVFQFDRELSIGSVDFTEALIQKVKTIDGDHSINAHEAEQLKLRYGFPLDKEGVTDFLHIEAFKLLILLRSEGERLLSEINRSIDFYRKIHSLPPLESDIFISGPGAKIPNIDSYISNQLNRTVHRIYPLRSASVRYADGIDAIPVEFLPKFDLALAAATEINNHTNLIPKALKFEEKFIPAYMASVILLLLTFLAVTVSSFAISAKMKASIEKVEKMEEKIATISPMGQKYSTMINYHNVAYGIKNEINYDAYYSEVVTSLIKSVAQNTQEEIKLTQFIINREELVKDGAKNVKSAKEQDGNKVWLHLQGFVSTSSAIADVVLENYRIKLSNSGYYTNVDILSKSRESANGLIRLRFTMQAGIKD